MFTNEDHIAYFDELEEILKKTLVIYTDLLNELTDKAIRNKIYSISFENMEAFRYISANKKKFI